MRDVASNTIKLLLIATTAAAVAMTGCETSAGGAGTGDDTGDGGGVEDAGATDSAGSDTSGTGTGQDTGGGDEDTGGGGGSEDTSGGGGGDEDTSGGGSEDTDGGADAGDEDTGGGGGSEDTSGGGGGDEDTGGGGGDEDTTIGGGDDATGGDDTEGPTEDTTGGDPDTVDPLEDSVTDPQEDTTDTEDTASPDDTTVIDDTGPQAPINDPCEVSDAPGSTDQAVTACVCALDPFCCQSAWDSTCVDEAEEECGAACDCTDQACETTADCGCPGNACDGEWACVDNTCQMTGGIDCPGIVGQCVFSGCDPVAGECVETVDDQACDDFDPCTIDTCNPDTAQCEYVDDETCGAVVGPQSPCMAAETPGANDEEIVGCVCALDPFCCESAWDGVCVGEAQNECGAVCDCAEASDEALACEVTADCAWCGEDACSGVWSCIDGACTASAPVICDAGSDTECATHSCNPATGACELAFDDDACDDGDTCTSDFCDEAGACAVEPIEDCGGNHPCSVAATPGSSNPDVDACVCAIDASCCEVGWGGNCIQIGEALCDLTCDCGSLPDEEKACESDEDCAFCDDDNVCNGVWSCVDSLCVVSDPIVCDTAGDGECAVTACAPDTGECIQSVLPELCEDGDVCTVELCGEDGNCAWEEQEGCGANHPCIASPFPGSADEEVTDCVCALDGFCCSTAWDGICTGVAEDQCGAVCVCDDPVAPVECVTNTDCAGCDDGDLCNGFWECTGGVCVADGPPVVCDNSGDQGCLQNLCVPTTGKCEASVNEAACDDDDSCTVDACNEDGTCSHVPSGTCDNHPCEVSDGPGSNDTDITNCVCDVDPYCCETAWDGICVGEVTDVCGLSCDCSDPDADLSCNLDEDCSFCSDDLCTGAWGCINGLCTATDPVVCDDSGDTECIVNACDPETGTCELITTPEACDDGDFCTLDSCNEAGACVHEEQPGCEGPPPYECLGLNQPSLEGCEAVDSFEGCCDPWGRVTWCDGGQTFCIDCSENPVCGWNGDAGFYDCGADTPVEDPSGTSPYVCGGF